MNLRQALLKILLWSLGIGAVLGAALMLVAPSEAVWRIIGTCFATAAAALLMLGCALLLDRPRGRAAGLLGMSSVIVYYLLTLTLIWSLPHLLGMRRWEGDLTVSLIVCAPVILAVMLLLGLRGTALGRVAAPVGVVLAAGLVVLIWIAVWTEDFWRNDQWAATAGFFALFATLVVAALIGSGTGDRRWWRWIAVAASVVSYGFVLFEIWGPTYEFDNILLALAIAVSAYPAYANVLMLCPLKPSQRWLRIVTLFAAAVMTVCIVLAVYLDFGVVFDRMVRIGGAAGIIAGCGTLALIVFARLNRKLHIKPQSAELKEITLVCPLCSKKQTLRLGESACAACGLEFDIKVHEPRCPHCDYMLLMLDSDRCPECGTPIVRAEEAVAAG